MTGRELIMYILENHLEDEPVFQKGTFVGYMSDAKFAETLGVGLATVHAWVLLGTIDGSIMIGDTIYIPVNYATQLKNEQTQNQGSDCKCGIN